MSLAGAKFILLDEMNKRTSSVLEAKGRKFTAGYYVDNDCILEDSRAMGVHCEIQCDAFGRVVIHNRSEQHPISLNDQPIAIKRPLLNGNIITILNKKYLWEFPRVPSAQFEDLITTEQLTPQKLLGVPEETANSCPDLRLHREPLKRLTVHNFAYCIQSEEKGNTMNLDNKEDSPSTFTSIASINAFSKKEEETTGTHSTTEMGSKRSFTPELEPEPEKSNETPILVKLECTPRMSLITSTQNKENTTTQKKQKLLSFCQQSDIVITSFSPRETGVRIEKSFTAVLKPMSNTPKSVYTTPKSVFSDLNDDDSNDFIDFSTPATSKKCQSRLATNSSMHLIDLTTPSRLKLVNQHSKLTPKSATKKNALTTHAEEIKLEGSSILGVSVLPVTPTLVSTPKPTPKSNPKINDDNNSKTTVLNSAGSVISVDSSVESLSVIDVSSEFTSVTPIKHSTVKTAIIAKSTPDSLMKRVLITSTKTQQQLAKRTRLPTVETQLKAVTPRTPNATSAKSNLLARRRTLTTPTRKLPANNKSKVDSVSAGTSSSMFAAASAARRSVLSQSIEGKSAGRALISSTPVGRSRANLRENAKTSPLHKVRKSFAHNMGQVSRLGKARQCVAPSRSAQLLAKARKTLYNTGNKSSSEVLTTAENFEVEITNRVASVAEMSKTSSRPAQQDDLNHTFTLNSEKSDNGTAETKAKDSTFSPVRECLTVEMCSERKTEARVEIPIDVSEVKLSASGSSALASSKKPCEETSVVAESDSEEIVATIDESNVISESFAEILEETDTNTMQVELNVERIKELRESSVDIKNEVESKTDRMSRNNFSVMEIETRNDTEALDDMKIDSEQPSTTEYRVDLNKDMEAQREAAFAVARQDHTSDSTRFTAPCESSEGTNLLEQIEYVLNKSDELEQRQLLESEEPSGEIESIKSELVAELNELNWLTESKNLETYNATNVSIAFLEAKPNRTKGGRSSNDTTAEDTTSEERHETSATEYKPDVDQEKQLLAATSVFPCEASNPSTELVEAEEKENRLNRTQSSPSPSLHGLREMLRTPKDRDATTPRFAGLRELVRTPKLKQNDDIELFEGVASLLKTPKLKPGMHEHKEEEGLVPETSVQLSTAGCTPRRSTRRASLSAETAELSTLVKDAVFTPRRSSRRASMSAETASSSSTCIPFCKSRRSSLSADSATMLTPKRITTRRTSMTLDDNEAITLATLQVKTPRANRVIEDNVPDMNVIVEEENIVTISDAVKEECQDVRTKSTECYEKIVDFCVPQETSKNENIEQDAEKREKYCYIKEGSNEATNESDSGVTETCIRLEPIQLKEETIDTSSTVAEKINSTEHLMNEAALNEGAVIEESICEEVSDSNSSCIFVPEGEHDDCVVNVQTVEAVAVAGQENPVSEIREVDIQNVSDDDSCEIIEYSNHSANNNSDVKLPTFAKDMCDVLDKSEYDYGKEIDESNDENTVVQNSQDNVSTPKAMKSAKLKIESPTTPVMTGMRELLKTPKTVPGTPRYVGLRDIMRTPKRDENKSDDEMILEGFGTLVRTPEINVHSEVEKSTIVETQSEVEAEKPSTSCKVQKEFIGLREMMQTPKSTSTPRFKGLKELMHTPKVCSTPKLSGLKELMDTPLRESINVNVSSVTLAETNVTKNDMTGDSFDGEESKKNKYDKLDRFFSTPSAKDIMIPNAPPSAVLQKNNGHIEILNSTECNFNDPNLTNFDNIFKTPMATILNKDISTVDKMEDEKSEAIPKYDTNIIISTPAEKAFDQLTGHESTYQSPVRKVYTRKGPASSSQSSPFSASDVISDLPKTDIQEWVDSLEKTEVLKEELEESVQQVVEEKEITIQSPSRVENTHSKSKEFVKTVGGHLETNSHHEMEKETEDMPSISVPSKNEGFRCLTPVEAEMSGLDLLDQTGEGSMLSEPLLMSDTESNKSLEDPPKEEVQKSAVPTTEEVENIEITLAVNNGSTEKNIDDILDTTNENDNCNKEFSECPRATSSPDSGELLSEVSDTRKNSTNIGVLTGGNSSETKEITVLDPPIINDGFTSNLTSDEFAFKSEFKNFKDNEVVRELRSATPNQQRLRSKPSRNTLDGRENLKVTIDLKAEKLKFQNSQQHHSEIMEELKLCSNSETLATGSDTAEHENRESFESSQVDCNVGEINTEAIRKEEESALQGLEGSHNAPAVEIIKSVNYDVKITKTIVIKDLDEVEEQITETEPAVDSRTVEVEEKALPLLHMSTNSTKEESELQPTQVQASQESISKEQVLPKHRGGRRPKQELRVEAVVKDDDSELVHVSAKITQIKSSSNHNASDDHQESTETTEVADDVAHNIAAVSRTPQNRSTRRKKTISESHPSCSIAGNKLLKTLSKRPHSSTDVSKEATTQRRKQERKNVYLDDQNDELIKPQEDVQTAKESSNVVDTSGPLLKSQEVVLTPEVNSTRPKRGRKVTVASTKETNEPVETKQNLLSETKLKELTSEHRPITKKSTKTRNNRGPKNRLEPIDPVGEPALPTLEGAILEKCVLTTIGTISEESVAPAQKLNEATNFTVGKVNEDENRKLNETTKDILVLATRRRRGRKNTIDSIDQTDAAKNKLAKPIGELILEKNVHEEVHLTKKPLSLRKRRGGINEEAIITEIEEQSSVSSTAVKEDIPHPEESTVRPKRGRKNAIETEDECFEHELSVSLEEESMAAKLNVVKANATSLKATVRRRGRKNTVDSVNDLLEGGKPDKESQPESKWASSVEKPKLKPTPTKAEPRRRGGRRGKIEAEEAQLMELKGEVKQDIEGKEIEKELSGKRKAPSKRENKKKIELKGGKDMDLDKDKVKEILIEVSEDTQKTRKRKETHRESESDPMDARGEPSKKRTTKRTQAHAEEELDVPIEIAITTDKTAAPLPLVESATIPISKRTRKASALNVDHVIVDEMAHSPVPKQGRHQPRRAAAAQPHNYDESSDNETHQNDRHYLQRIDVSVIDGSTVDTSRGGRTRKPTAKVQQFLEEERAKTSTPKRRLLESAAQVSSQKTSVKRGRRAAADDVEVESIAPYQAAVAPTARKGRGRRVLNEDITTTSEDMDVDEKLASTSRSGQKTKIIYLDMEEPLNNKLVKEDLSEKSENIVITTLEELQVETEQPQKGTAERTKRTSATKTVHAEAEEHTTELGDAIPKLTAGTRKRGGRAAKAKQADISKNENIPENDAGTEAVGEFDVETFAGQEPEKTAPKQKRTRRKQVDIEKDAADTQVPTPKVTRAARGGRKVVHFEQVDNGVAADITAAVSDVVAVTSATEAIKNDDHVTEAPAPKRATRARRK